MFVIDFFNIFAAKTYCIEYGTTSFEVLCHDCKDHELF